jgi:polar amino acid transport system substrate-binding protein
MLLLSPSAFAQDGYGDPPNPPIEDGLGAADYIRVDCAEFPQIVTLEDERYTGFLIELWETIASEQGWQYRYREAPKTTNKDADHYDEAFKKLESGETDILLSACTKTSLREERIDFSDQYYRSGLRIIVPKQEAPWYSFLLGFLSPSILKAIGVIVCVLFVGGFFMWFFERKRSDSEVKTLDDGVQLAFETGSTIGHGFLHPKSKGAMWTGRIVFVMGAICFGNLISEMTAEKTVSRIEGSIGNYRDLAGKAVSTVQGTTAVRTLESLGADVEQCGKLGDAMLKMLIGEADAVVYDWPALAYYLNETSAGERCEAVGSLFDIQYYGVAFPKDSTLREQFNIGLNRLRESGAYNEIYNKWFPEDD